MKVALVTGQHPHEVVPFHDAFHSIPDLRLYPQHLEDFVSDVGGHRAAYDAVVFYNFHQDTPGEFSIGWKDLTAALTSIGDTPQGYLVLHHALLAYPRWPFWSALTGIENRSFGYHINQQIRVEVANTDHPITAGMTAWDMIDETYTMADCSPENTVLLTVDHPLSMRTIAWTRQHRQSRILCWQSGHDGQTFNNPHFRAFLQRGLLWLANRI